MRLIILAGAILLTLSCNYRYSQDLIPEVPVIDAEFKSNALLYLDEMIQSDPSNLALYLEKLNFYRDQGWPATALSTINKSIELDSSNLTLFKYREEYFLTNGNYRMALIDINHLLKRDFKDPILKVDAAHVLFKLNRIDESLTILDNPLVRNLEDKRIQQLKADILLLKGDTLLAMRNFYLSYMDGASNAYMNAKLIDLLMATNQWSRVDQILSDLISTDSSYLFVLAQVKFQVGEDVEGKRILRNLTLEEGSAKALKHLSAYFNSQSLYDSVIYYNNYYVNNYDSINQAFLSIGRAYEKKGWWTNTLMYYDLVLQTDPENEDALKETQKVKGKIAYLRKLKEQQKRLLNNTELPKKKLEF